MTSEMLQLLPEDPPAQLLPVAILGVDEQGFIRYCNHRGRKLLRSEISCHMGELTIYDLFPELDRDRPLFGLDESYLRELPPRPQLHCTQLHLPGGEAIPVEAYFLTSGEENATSWLWCAIQSLEPMRELQNLVDALTLQQQQVKEQINYYARLTSKLYESTHEGVLLLDNEGIVQSVNPAYTVLTGFSQEEVLGKPIELCRHPEDDEELEPLSEMLAQAARLGTLQRKWRNCRRNGTDYTELLTLHVVTDCHDQPQNYIVVCQELSHKGSDGSSSRGYQDDPLTGLPTRPVLTDRLIQVLGHSQRSGEKVALVLIGIDGFRKVNDSLGHEAGDTILRVLSHRFQALLRVGDTVARMGSDEFGFIIRDVRTTQSVLMVIRKIQDALKEPLPVGESDVSFTACMGISVSPEDSAEAETLLRYANASLSRAKSNGVNNFTFFTHAMEQNAAKRLALEGRLRKAIDNDELTLFYQPKISCKSQQIEGFEALVRWITPDNEIISPGDFIPIAEDTGLIIPLGNWVIDRVCRDIIVLEEANFPAVLLSANLSPRQFQQEDLMKVIDDALTRHKVDPKRLELEITESSVMGDVESASQMLMQMVERNIQIALDDFGTGYSSLAYLKRFPFHTLKVDRAFIRTVESDPADQAILHAIVTLAQNLGLKIVAEGVENEDQRKFVSQAGCDMIQGFFYSRPLNLQTIMQQWDQLATPDS
uniref:Putative diguanylate cyclase/phosphodiesterase with PAS/PAC sensor(S) n=1 Tax=Magnetococcus massalia (strain MO-1) TaxID=451514 RepID=A0A1S7LH73_MAGMO|nr:Putative diguanylate cyclase/phosphodiesterase with PAS/PAC sensor(S) [Candidatus Magnetococcus massalia]